METMSLVHKLVVKLLILEKRFHARSETNEFQEQRVALILGRLVNSGQEAVVVWKIQSN